MVREGFSWGALLFGPIWLAVQLAWIPAVLCLCVEVLVGLLPGPWSGVGASMVGWAMGVFGRDLVRWSLERRGFLMAHVVAARDEDAAFARLMAARPDLVSLA